MVLLPNTSAQYAFLQLLSQTYVYTLANLRSGSCMVSPQIFTDCTDYRANGYLRDNIPYLPTVNDLQPSGNYDIYGYSDYSQVYFYGFNSQNFPAANVTTAATAMLFAACGANATCTAAYKKLKKNAAPVIQSLVKTNVNSIALVLKQNPTLYWFPYRGWGALSQVYQNTPPPNAETYGLHNGPVFGIARGTVNASAYMSQVNLGRMLAGGFQMYEALIHTAAIGSWSVNDNAQSNINLTGTQVFTHLTRGSGLDSRSEVVKLNKSAMAIPYETKWEVWKEEARLGTHIPNREAVFDIIKTRITESQPYYNAPHHRNVLAARRPEICIPPNTQQGIDWLEAIKSSICTAADTLSSVQSLTKAISPALEASARGLLTPEQFNNVNRVFANIFAGQVASMCAEGGSDGTPCYPSTSAWQIASGAFTVLNTLAEVEEYANPAGEVILATNLFCGLSDIAHGFYEGTRKCCASDCNSPSCQTTYGGCTQGTGVC